ncbi:LOW QUALITY PROTEIN: uncharacterized protein C4orf54-like [Aulostomus maculatus]
MEAAEETLTYRDDTGLYRKLLPEDKDQGHVLTKTDESNYVDLDMRPDGAKTVKVTFTGEGNQLSVIKCDGARQGEQDARGDIISEDAVGEQPEDKRVTGFGLVSGERPVQTLPEFSSSDQENEKQRQAELDPSDCSESDELRYTDMYLNSREESDDGASAVLSDHCGSDTAEDESHYITTHEIQLTELDHDVDYDLGRGTSWDFEDDNLVYSFVDYASFESDETQEGTLILEGRSQANVQSNLGGAVVSTEQDESDLCDSDKCASSDESVCKNQSGDANVGKIHLSIKSSSRAAKESVNKLDNGGHAKHFEDRDHISFVSSGARAPPLRDRAQYFIPAPGRQHLATKLRRKDINEYSSGASSSISELDDADKEVRNLTAKSFRSLAGPYFDAINLRTSSESSMSEYGLNKWSTFVDLNYGNISRGRERSVIAHQTSSATLEMNKSLDNKRHGKSIAVAKTQQTKSSAMNKRPISQQTSSSIKKAEARDAHPKQRGVTLNFRCNVEAPAGARRPKSSRNTRCNEVTGAVVTRSGCEMQYHNTDSMGDTHKRAIFASSLLKNVISKKMQFEQERKMERGEICDTHPTHSLPLKDQEGMRDRSVGRGLQRQSSESGSGFTGNSGDDQPPEDSRPSSCEPAEEHKEPDVSEKGHQEKMEPLDCPKSQLSHSQNSAFNSWKEDEPEPVTDTQTTKQTATKQELDTSSMLTKLLFVPSCQRLSKEKEVTDQSGRTPATDAPAGPQACEKEFKTGNNENTVGKEETERGRKTPEIKICLRSVKENKGCTLNIANLLTPKISYNTVNTFRTAGEAKCQIFSTSDKIPTFTVRDIRDNKCKFQTPIYHVRDVRKLVKSSYRFVSLDNSKCSGASLTTADKLDEKSKKEPVKHLLPSPIVIKCHSVKTNVKPALNEASHKQAEAEVQSENTPSHLITSRAMPVVAKQLNLDQSETNSEKLLKHRQEKFPGESTERRFEPTIPKQAALEKLKAAVKTMEQLYVFDRNEWKRKAQAPRPITDSHVLSLIASEEQGAEELETTLPQTQENPQRKGSLKIIQVPYSNDDTFKTQPQQSKTFSNKSVLHFGNKSLVSISSVSNPAPQSSTLSSTMKSSKTPAAPLSVKIEPPKHEQVKVNPSTVTQASSDAENYLTIPGYTNEIKLLPTEPVAREVNSNIISEQKKSPLIVEYPASSVYHHPAAQTQQVLCFSPSVTTVSPTPSSGETVPQTQRKMLLDPTTGHYYLVDTPIQATTKRLFDPETGQYVDVPHSPVAPVTPVPLSLPPLALNPGAYAPTYMIYPGFIPSPTLPAQALLPQSPCHSEEAGGEKIKSASSSNAAGAETTYYSATGETPHRSLQLPVSLGHVSTRGTAASSDRKPIISITTQQGPRIIAPPSFDGTTMSFVVEHR